MLKTKYNATIGMATNKNGKMYADTLFDVYNHLSPDEVFPYAPSRIRSFKGFMARQNVKENLIYRKRQLLDLLSLMR